MVASSSDASRRVKAPLIVEYPDTPRQEIEAVECEIMRRDFPYASR